MGVVLQIERHAPPVVERYCHARRADALDATERPVLHTQVTFILEEHDAVAFRKSALAAPDLERDLIAERLARFQPPTHRLVELKRTEARRVGPACASKVRTREPKHHNKNKN